MNRLGSEKVCHIAVCFFLFSLQDAQLHIDLGRRGNKGKVVYFSGIEIHNPHVTVV